MAVGRFLAGQTTHLGQKYYKEKWSAGAQGQVGAFSVGSLRSLQLIFLPHTVISFKRQQNQDYFPHILFNRLHEAKLTKKKKC